jgi:uncharacterized protein
MTATSPSPLPRHSAKRLTMMLSKQDHARHTSLMIALLKRARRAKLSGATVFEAHEGFGASGRVHRSHVLSDDSPITVVFVDLPDRIDAFLEDVSDLLVDVLVIVDDIDVIEL